MYRNIRSTLFEILGFEPDKVLFYESARMDMIRNNRAEKASTEEQKQK